MVRGTYHPAGGRYRYGPDGSFLLNHVTCCQDAGRCCQTLCALHRYNRRGRGTWYPDRVYAMGERTCARAGKQPGAKPSARRGTLDLEA